MERYKSIALRKLHPTSDDSMGIAISSHSAEPCFWPNAINPKAVKLNRLLPRKSPPAMSFDRYTWRKLRKAKTRAGIFESQATAGVFLAVQ